MRLRRVLRPGRDLPRHSEDLVHDRAMILHDNRFGYKTSAGLGRTETTTLPRLGVEPYVNKWHCVATAYDKTTAL